MPICKKFRLFMSQANVLDKTKQANSKGSNMDFLLL